jgi:hypothetical protein
MIRPAFLMLKIGIQDSTRLFVYMYGVLVGLFDLCFGVAFERPL